MNVDDRALGDIVDALEALQYLTLCHPTCSSGSVTFEAEMLAERGPDWRAEDEAAIGNAQEVLREALDRLRGLSPKR